MRVGRIVNAKKHVPTEGLRRAPRMCVFVFLAFFAVVEMTGAQNAPPQSPAPEAQPPQGQPQQPQPVNPPPDLPPPPMDQSGTDALGLPSPVAEAPKRPGLRDPFAKPKSLLDREAEANRPVIDPAVYIDSRIEPIRRWPLRSYRLVAIIFDVENPKAMIKDPEGTMHLVSRSQRIGNQEGVITAIERGEVKVEEKEKIVPIRLQR